jgi:hypothetical protein
MSPKIKKIIENFYESEMPTTKPGTVFYTFIDKKMIFILEKRIIEEIDYADPYDIESKYLKDRKEKFVTVFINTDNNNGVIYYDNDYNDSGIIYNKKLKENLSPDGKTTLKSLYEYVNEMIIDINHIINDFLDENKDK